MLDVVPSRSRLSHSLSIGLALLALGFALRVRPVSWMLVLYLVPTAILTGAVPRVFQVEHSHPRVTRACGVLRVLGYLSFLVGLALHGVH